MKNKKKKRTFLICSAAVFALIAALIFCLSMMARINSRMNDSAIANLLNTTQVIADTLEGAIEKDYDALNVVGTMYIENGVPETEQFFALRETIELDWIGIADSQGNGVDCFGNQYRISDYSSASGWNLKEKGCSDAYVGNRSGRPQITLWVPIYNGDEYLGAVLGNVILTQYYSANVFTFYEGEGRTYLFNGTDGTWILKSLGTDGAATRKNDIYSLLEASGNEAEDIDAFRKAVEERQTGAAILNFNGERSYIGFLPMQSSQNWYVATVIARDKLQREASEVQHMIGWVMVILCGTLVYAAVVLAVWLVRKTKEEETNYRQALFANVSSNLDSAFLIYEKDGKETVFVSDNIRRLLGLDREWIAEDAGRLFNWCRIPVEDEQRTAFLEGKLDKPAVREVRVENELGEKARTIRLELIPADLEQEIAVLTDITKDMDVQQSLIEAMQQAENANRAKNSFMSAMSHDLRTPINGIVGMIAIAEAHIEETGRVRDCLNKISESTEQLLRLINEVLDMSQIESGKLELASEPFNIAKHIQSVLSVNYPGFQQKNHTVKVHIHMLEHEEVIGDPVNLTRITANLISNAIKYTKSGGMISLTLQEKPTMIQGHGCYELTVQDNGIGISPQFQEKIFEPFEREEDVRLSRIQGTGLGMSIVKSIVELMMGNISVESEKGKGTTFRVTVNLRLNEKAKQQANHLAGRAVLVVDDDPDILQTVTDILRNSGMEGDCTDSSNQAVEMIEARHREGEDYMAVLLKWQMPDMKGSEIVKRIRAVAGEQVPGIILTAYEWGEIEAEASEAGMSDFLPKPIYKSAVLEKLTEVSGRCQDQSRTIKLPSEGQIPPGKKVLLAEDNELNREIAVGLLQLRGVEVDCADNGEEVVERFADSVPGTYSLILMDIQMPRLNGYEATRKIRSMERKDSRTVPIIAMTADAFSKDVRAAFEAGMDEHLSKPISIERLEQLLGRFLANSTEKQEETSHEKA